MEISQENILTPTYKLKQEEIFYVYLHKDDFENVFYIGKGTSKYFTSHKRRYKRAYTISRSKRWKSYVAKYASTLIVEIVQTFTTEREALDYESSLIAKYGIKGKGGSLVNNKTSDDENYDYSFKIRDAVPKIPVFMYTLNGDKEKDFSSITEAAAYLKVHPTDISCAIGSVKGRTRHTVKGYRFSKINLPHLSDIKYNRKKKIEKVHLIKIKKDMPIKVIVPKKEPRKVYQYDLSGKYIDEHTDIKNIKGVSYGGIRNNLCGITNTCGGYIWSLDKKEELIVKPSNRNFVQVFCKNVETKEVHKFKTISSCAYFLGVPQVNLPYYIRKGLPINGFLIEKTKKSLDK